MIRGREGSTIDINKMKALSLEEMRAIYKIFLHSKDFAKSTVSTSYSDSFYLWKKESKDLFWNVVTSTDFESVAKEVLFKALTDNTTGNVNSLEIEKPITVKPSHMSREIIINKMYVGGYLLEGDNIGHEIINLYKADDGKNYIYLNSQGTIELSHGENRITVLLVRKFASKIYKILANAEGITILDFADSKLSRKERY